MKIAVRVQLSICMHFNGDFHSNLPMNFTVNNKYSKRENDRINEKF